MKPDARFQKMPKHFWATVRTVSQHIGYTVRGIGEIRVPNLAEIIQALQDLPLRTLARRVDGAFPSTINPIAVWEIKEYYYTTTFGSRVADGVYETLLDGMELEELREKEGIDIKHYLMLDARYTWWDCGRSYLCRVIDMLHTGYVDEVLFGREVIDRLPSLVRSWVSAARKRC